MNKNYITALVIIAVIIVGGFLIINNINTKPDTEADNFSATNNPVSSQANNSENQTQGEVKEFKMDSFYEVVDGKTKPQYSLKEITVNKGDTVKIQITVTKGAHNFNIDEYNISAETPLNQPITVEFKADKAGEFIYYCSKPGHREAGHWGTLKVL